MTFVEQPWERAHRQAEFKRVLSRLSEDNLRALDEMARKAERGELADFDYVAVARAMADIDLEASLAELRPVPDDLRRFDHDGLRYQLTMDLAPYDREGHAEAQSRYLDILRRRRDRHEAMPTLPDRQSTRARGRR